MVRLQLGHWQLPLRITVALVAGGIFPACQQRESPAPAPAPEPGTGCPHGVEPRTAAELKACLQGLRFDPSPEVSDSQPLTVIDTSRAAPQGSPCPGDPGKSCRYGPLAKIEPVIGAQNYREDDLRQGRIIARLSIPSSQTEGYGKFGLRPGQNTYWWVQTDASGTGGTSFFITETKDGNIEPKPVRRDLVRYFYQEGEELRRAITQWIWSLEDETAKGTCGSASCK
jgi:hypothetical protein